VREASDFSTLFDFAYELPAAPVVVGQRKIDAAQGKLQTRFVAFAFFPRAGRTVV